LVVHGDKLISGSDDDTIKVWSTDNWTCELILDEDVDDVVTR
jgi:hypothetical protein